MNDLRKQLYKNLLREGKELLADVAVDMNSFHEWIYDGDNLQPCELAERHHTTYIAICLALALFNRGIR